MAETCSECGKLTRTGEQAQREHFRQKPIYGTDFTRPLSETISNLRLQISQIRGQLSDIGFAYPGWGERTKDVEGLLTCGLVTLYGIMEEMQKVEKAEREFGG